MLKATEVVDGKKLLNGRMEDTKSQLLNSESAFRRLVLEAVGGGYAQTVSKCIF